MQCHQACDERTVDCCRSLTLFRLRLDIIRSVLKVLIVARADVFTAQRNTSITYNAVLACKRKMLTIVSSKTAMFDNFDLYTLEQRKNLMFVLATTGIMIALCTSQVHLIHCKFGRTQIY